MNNLPSNLSRPTTSHQSSMTYQSITTYADLLPLIFQEQFMYFPIFPLASQNKIKEFDDSGQTNTELPITQKKGCNCKKSQCLKQYCDCFAEGKECSSECQCRGCHNQQEFRPIRDKAMLSILKRDPKAFSQKIDEVKTKRVHNRGCNCKKSGCSKKYCECYQAGVACMDLCKCTGCQNNGPDITHFHTFKEKKTCLQI